MRHDLKALLLTASFSCALLVGTTFGQGSFVTTFGGGTAEHGVGVVLIPDGYLIATRVWNEQTGKYEGQLFRRSLNGQALSVHPMNMAGAIFLQAACPLPDGGGFAVGSVIPDGAHEHNGLVVRFSAAGEVIWSASPAVVGEEQYLGVTALANGDAVVCGMVDTGNGHDGAVLRFNAMGDLLWTHIAGDVLDEELHAVATNGNSLLATGRAMNFGGTSDTYALHLGLDGQALWSDVFGGAADEEGRAVAPLGSEGYVIAGHTRSFGPTDHLGRRQQNVHLIALATNGDTLWTRTYGDTLLSRRPFGLDLAPNGDLLLCGERYSTTGSVALVVRFDPSGTMLWERTFDLGVGERLLSLRSMPDGFVSTGWAFEASGYQVLLIKRDANGF